MFRKIMCDKNMSQVSIHPIFSTFSTGQSAGGHPENNKPKKIWSEHKTEAGKVYFYNSVTKQSVWERPRDMDEEQGDEKKPADMDDLPTSANAAKISKGDLVLFQCFILTE